MKKKKEIFILIVRLLIICAIAGVLAWMFLAGGCLGVERVKLHQVNARMDLAVIYLTLGVSVGISCLLLFAFYSRTKLVSSKCLALFFSKLLI